MFLLTALPCRGVQGHGGCAPGYDDGFDRAGHGAKSAVFLPRDGEPTGGSAIMLGE
jgi:hypothetical protein